MRKALTSKRTTNFDRQSVWRTRVLADSFQVRYSTIHDLMGHEFVHAPGFSHESWLKPGACTNQDADDGERDDGCGSRQPWNS